MYMEPEQVILFWFLSKSNLYQLTMRFAILVLISFGFFSTSQAYSQEKEVIGPTATVEIKEAGIKFKGRVDTGAKTTSINATVLNVKDGKVKYSITNKDWEIVTLTSDIQDVRVVKNAEASEKRYYVYLTIVYRDKEHKVLVNLNDRTRSTYKILLGRNWLKGNYVVDVSLKGD